MARRLSNREIKELECDREFSKKDIVEIEVVDGREVLCINGTNEFFRYNGRWVPTLKKIYAGSQAYTFKSITVDMGAVKFVTNGADVMRPGIKEIEDGIQKGELILVKEIGHGKVLAIGEALLSSDEMKALEKGKAIKNIHYVGDKLWSM